MNIYQLRQFVALSRSKSITRAAEILHISQQALSKSIGQLESEWNTRLFNRDKNGISLTPVGNQLLPVAISLLQKYDEHIAMIQDVLAQNEYMLRLSIENDILLNALSFELLSRVGNLRISTTIAQGLFQCMNDIASGEADLALVTNPPESADFRFFPLLERVPTVILPQGHLLASRDHISIRSLKDERHIWITQSSSACDEYIRACMDEGFYPRFAAAYPSAKMVLQAIEDGKGISIGFEMFHLSDESGIVRKPLRSALRYKLGLLIHPDRIDDPNIRSYCKALQSCF
jgi:DNA-binding transcriptional LysR family regulator